MIYGFDIGAIIKATLGNILQAKILLVFCIDSKSLYDCLVKLGIIHKKCLMINIMSVRQSYKRCKITEIKWIHKYNNPADSIIKNKLSSALKTLIDINWINLDTTE